MICRWLRSKALYGNENLPMEALHALLAAHETPCTCLQTAQNWGPDDLPVTPAGCDDQRPCFEARRSTPRT